MSSPLSGDARQQLDRLAADGAETVPAIVDLILSQARQSRVSDVHLTPSAEALLMDWRIDGVLHDVYAFPESLKPNIVARLKVASELLTYRTDVPQEGRIRDGRPGEVRVSTFPTVHGERAVIRLFADPGKLFRLHDLGLTPSVADELSRSLNQSGGAILISGPAGSGKTTTAYACLREIVATSDERRSVVSLEDPVESLIHGVAQSQIRPASGFDYPTGLRSLMRQDPEVIFVGEIRDRPTAEIVLQAALSGHLVLTTFHAGSAAGAIGRLLDMGIEPFQVRSGVRAILSQRLLRTLCECRGRQLGGCESCRGTGYVGRRPIAEVLTTDESSTGKAIIAREDASEIGRRAEAAGMIPLRRNAEDALALGLVDEAEITRVLGCR
ncbi:GspE/PulE family protein [Stratiformator vulcanicus]|uniref:Type II secretion system protein E n=1 Tax=Stratiformator vulcanicus TaxID=2527980 RepID=A0A517QWY9_9PLAN|nr:GspE/PulE family protein [Stratiformator vulcanicus]QDT36179.1 Type II secretion system protein E [Stratiformator vulcanicus]